MIVVEGGIAAGKSTVLRYIATFWKHPIYLEPVAVWAPLLEKYYRGEDVGLQLQAKITVDTTVGLDTSPLSVHERCAWMQPGTFVRLMQQEGRLDDAEADLLCELCCRLAYVPDHVIYLRCEPGEAYRRLQQRARPCEQKVSEDYLRKLHGVYEDAMALATRSTEVYTIDVTHRCQEEVNSLVGFYMESLA